jgi:hypothetical protein
MHLLIRQLVGLGWFMEVGVLTFSLLTVGGVLLPFIYHC